MLGSTTWCSSWPPRAQRRAAVPEVANPPEPIATVWPGTRAWGAVCRPVGDTGRPTPHWWRTHYGEVAPRLTSTPVPTTLAARQAARSAHKALAVAPRSKRAPLGTHAKCRSAQGTDVLPEGDVPGGDDQGQVEVEVVEVAVVAQVDEALADCGVDQAVGLVGGINRYVQRFGEPWGRRSSRPVRRRLVEARAAVRSESGCRPSRNPRSRPAPASTAVAKLRRSPLPTPRREHPIARKFSNARRSFVEDAPEETDADAVVVVGDVVVDAVVLELAAVDAVVPDVVDVRFAVVVGVAAVEAVAGVALHVADAVPEEDRTLDEVVDVFAAVLVAACVPEVARPTPGLCARPVRPSRAYRSGTRQPTTL